MSKVKEYFKRVFSIIVPLIIGILIGSGLTADKRVFYTMISAIIAVMIFNLIKTKLVSIKEAEDKKEAVVCESKETLMDAGEATLKGNARGAKIFDNWYGDYIFFFNIGLLIATFALIYNQLYLWAFICFLALNLHVALNQSLRIMKELKSGLPDNQNNKNSNGEVDMYGHG